MGGPSPFLVGVAVLAVSVGVVVGNTEPTPEIQTEAPPPRPDALIAFKDCPVYVLGELRVVRRHGEQWKNDGSDCEICKCTDGQKRCYYHYCNSGVTEGYMTPPSAKGDVLGGSRAGDQARPPMDDEDHDHEGSGARPWDDPGYYEVVAKEDLLGPASRDDKNPQDNETHDPDALCPSPMPCHKSCPHGFKVDPRTGCRKCKCHKCGVVRCHGKCPGGFALDQRGCRTCDCLEGSAKVSVVTGIDKDFIMDDYAVSSPVYHDQDATFSQVSVSGGVYVTAEDSKSENDPACNTTRVAGCLDGRGVYAVGTWWDRGPCVTCTCASPGYTECNVTQCATPSCPPHRQALPDGACCPVCLPEPTRTHQAYYGRSESRSTSRVPLDRMPPPPTLPHDHHEPRHDHAPPRNHHAPSRNHATTLDGSTTKSAVQASQDWWQVVVIVVPVVVVFGLLGSLLVHFWRRYHRDKYDINAYRPDETEKLRPVKTVDDPQPQPVRHV